MASYSHRHFSGFNEFLTYDTSSVEEEIKRFRENEKKSRAHKQHSITKKSEIVKSTPKFTSRCTSTPKSIPKQTTKQTLNPSIKTTTITYKPSMQTTLSAFVTSKSQSQCTTNNITTLTPQFKITNQPQPITPFMPTQQPQQFISTQQSQQQFIRTPKPRQCNVTPKPQQFIPTQQPQPTPQQFMSPKTQQFNARSNVTYQTQSTPSFMSTQNPHPVHSESNAKFHCKSIPKYHSKPIESFIPTSYSNKDIKRKTKSKSKFKSAKTFKSKSKSRGPSVESMGCNIFINEDNIEQELICGDMLLTNNWEYLTFMGIHYGRICEFFDKDNITKSWWIGELPKLYKPI